MKGEADMTNCRERQCRRKERAIVFILLALLLTCLCPKIYAAGDGTGGGGGASIPLYMNWSYPGNGAVNVSVTPVIQCKFTHNVAQYTVVDRNKTRITLADDEGRMVDITVFTADSQIQFDKRQFIYVSPVKALEYGKTYVLTLHEGIQSKNNMATDEDQTISFTTEYKRSSFNLPLVSMPVSNDTGNSESESKIDSDSKTTGGTEKNNITAGVDSSQSSSKQGENSVSSNNNGTSAQNSAVTSSGGGSTSGVNQSKSGSTETEAKEYGSRSSEEVQEEEPDGAAANSSEGEKTITRDKSEKTESSVSSADKEKDSVGLTPFSIVFFAVLFFSAVAGALASAVLLQKRTIEPADILQNAVRSVPRQNSGKKGGRSG